MYIHIHRERERERDIDSISHYMYMHIYIYIYIVASRTQSVCRFYSTGHGNMKQIRKGEAIELICISIIINSNNSSNDTNNYIYIIDNTYANQEVTPLRASQSLSETFRCTGCKTCS